MSEKVSSQFFKRYGLVLCVYIIFYALYGYGNYLVFDKYWFFERTVLKSLFVPFLCTALFLLLVLWPLYRSFGWTFKQYNVLLKAGMASVAVLYFLEYYMVELQSTPYHVSSADDIVAEEYHCYYKIDYLDVNSKEKIIYNDTVYSKGAYLTHYFVSPISNKDGSKSNVWCGDIFFRRIYGKITPEKQREINSFFATSAQESEVWQFPSSGIFMRERNGDNYSFFQYIIEEFNGKSNQRPVILRYKGPGELSIKDSGIDAAFWVTVLVIQIINICYIFANEKPFGKANY